MIDSLREILSGPAFLIGWLALMLPSLLVLVRDLRERNAHLMSLMKVVWVLTVVYSGPVGLAVYWFSGRRQIRTDSVWRRGFRSVAHCYSGCGLGEITGVIIAAGVLALDNWAVATVTFMLAFAVGYALTVGPMIQEGVAPKDAFRDAFIAETPSIAIMEIVAIGADLLLAGEATMAEPLFWSSLIVSLSLGLLAAYPVNVLLIRFGVKEGMMDPREAH